MDTIEREITPDDSRMVRRMVGYWEYLKALQNLDQLANSLTESEREELDEYVKQRNLFAVDGNLSKRMQVGNSTLTDSKDAVEEHRGLNWMTALARVELGAMLSGYTNVPRPFEVVRPTPNDIDAYRYLLLDGIRSHYWSLKKDPSINYLLKSTNIYNVLSYSRRMKMVRSMIGTLTRSGRKWTYPEQQELVGWKSELDELSGLFIVSIRNYLTKHGESGTRTTKSSSSRYLTRICGAILQGERNELRAGTATQTSSTTGNAWGVGNE